MTEFIDIPWPICIFDAEIRSQWESKIERGLQLVMQAITTHIETILERDFNVSSSEVRVIIKKIWDELIVTKPLANDDADDEDETVVNRVIRHLTLHHYIAPHISMAMHQQLVYLIVTEQY